MKDTFIILMTLISGTSFALAADPKTEQQAARFNAQGEQYHFAQDGNQDFHKAKECYLQAVDLGSAVAANHLGRLYLNGEGVEQNIPQAQKWYAKSVELDPSLENKCLNNQYPNKMACAIILAAKQDSAPAQYQLGVLYEDGTTEFGQDLSKAFDLYLKAAEQEHRGAISAVIRCYEQGIGTVKIQLKLKNGRRRNQN